MRDYAKVGNRRGAPAYRTQATFRYRKYLKISKSKASDRHEAQKRKFPK